MATTLFKNGRIVDGSGKDSFDGSVLIDGDSIRHVFINGVHVVKDGAYIEGVRAGRALRC